ncbi:MAG: hypothetical protein J6U21_00890, partial [Bacteroidales bacterium]|nr:hypothetical protein [Bacteroidales bacterium]
MKYSDWHKELQKTFNDGDIAYITHRKQSPNVYNGSMTSGIVSPLALAYDIDSVGEIEYDVPFPPVSNPDFTFIDLFAGIGGF